MACIRLAGFWCLALLGAQAIADSVYAATNSAAAAREVSFVGSKLDSAVLAVVDGKPLTAAEVKEAVLVAAKVKDLSTGRSGKQPDGRRANLQAMHLAPQLVSSMVLDAELDRRGVKASAASDAAVFARYNDRFKRKSKTQAELFGRFGDLASAFRRQFARESRYREMFDSLPELKVSEEEVGRYFRGISNRMAKCERINRRATNQIERAWKELNGGHPWDVVATNYTEDALLDKSLADNWKDWLSINLNKIEPMDLMVAVSKLKPGEYTRPIETEEGMVIVKLLERDGDFCSMARILVRMAVAVDMPGREAAIKNIRKEKEVAFQKKTLVELKKKTKIEYPYGKRFAFKIWEEPVAQPNRAVEKTKKPAEK